MFAKAAQKLGVPEEQIGFVFCLIAAFPLASVYNRLPLGSVRHSYSIAVAAFFLIAVLKLWSGFFQLVFSIIGTYLIVIFNRTNRMPWLVFAFVMVHLTINHILRTIIDPSLNLMGITGAQMVLVMKLSSFAWNIHDGRRSLSELDAAQAATRLTKVPGLWSFLGYALFFPSVLIGPSFDFALYDSHVNKKLSTESNNNQPSTSSTSARSVQTASVTMSSIKQPDIRGDDDVSGSVARTKSPSGRKRVAYVHLAVGLGFLGAYALLGSKASYQNTLRPEWQSYSWHFKFLYVQAAGFIARLKYYGVWELSDGAMILCGFGFNGYDPKTGRTKWNKVRNIDIIRIETAENYKVLFDSWNMRTSIWLRESVYKRINSHGKKPGFKTTLATFTTSAFWHGTQPGYYMTFFHGGLLTSLGKLFRRNVRPLLLPPGTPASGHGPMPSSSIPPALRVVLKRAYDLLGWVAVQATLNYIVSSFMLLRLAESIQFYRATAWYGDILIVGSFLFFKLGGGKFLKRTFGGPPSDSIKTPTKTKSVLVVHQNGQPNPSIVISPPPSIVDTNSSGTRYGSIPFSLGETSDFTDLSAPSSPGEESGPEWAWEHNVGGKGKTIASERTTDETSEL
ncbi:Predicted membrane protein [Phaffia rhodozyma]|uniref:Predicted membrane protein n=1 Tax=Phaffia rhodozyma TaxID=264483 RepID=A0A0F7SNV2_PHARH|nr:Predicted membrane protein [Phaffia rhodozyma]